MNNYPRYKCHKVVSAFKIQRIESVPSEVLGEANSFCLWPVDHDLGPVEVSIAWMAKNQATGGGYLVIYADGYMSYSPAKAFEEGYTLETKAPDSKFDKVMRRIFLGLIYVAIAAGVGLLFGNVYDRFKDPASYSFVDKASGATCIVLIDSGDRVMNCSLPAPKPAIPETTHTTIHTEDDSMFFPESRT